MRATVLLFLAILFACTARLLIKRRAHALVGVVGLLVLAAPVAQNFTVNELSSDFLTREVTANTVIINRFEAGDLDVSGIAGQVGGAYVRQPFPGEDRAVPAARRRSSSCCRSISGAGSFSTIIFRSSSSAIST